MQLKWFVKYFVVILLLPTTLVHAQGWGRGPSHFLGVAIGGGTANNLFYQEQITPKLGGAGNFSVLYELHQKGFVFGLGVEAQYQYTREWGDVYIEEFSRIDKTNEQFMYGYVYNSVMTLSHDVRITFPVYMGYVSSSGVYALIGAKLSTSLFPYATTIANMYTQGDYAWSIEPIRNVGGNDFTSFGYYPEQTYQTQNPYIEKLWAAATAEIGSYIPLSANIAKTRLRAGVYVNYGIRIGQMPSLMQADYSCVNTDAYSQSQEDLQTNLQLNPLINTCRIGSKAHNLEVGVKLAVLINVNTYSPPCHCNRE